MNWETLMSFGDSITIGSRTYLGYPELAGEILRQRTNKEWNVFNISKADLTSVELHRMISSQFINLKQLTPDLITILIGINDIKRKTSATDFEIAYRQVVLKARLISSQSKIILFAIPYLKRGIKLPYSFSMNKEIESYNIIVRKLGVTFDLPVIELQLDDHHLADGIHLNDEGTAHVSKQVVDFVLEYRGLEISNSIAPGNQNRNQVEESR